MRNIKPKVQHFEEPTSYLYDSINTRVPPMNISGKKSPPILSKIQWESPNTLMHSRSYQNFPLEKGMLRRESPQPNYRNYYEPERIERIERPNGQTMRHEYPFFEPQMPQPAIRSSRPAIYRPALANLSNKAVFPDRQMNLNPFEVVEQLFLEENNRNEKEFMNSAKHEVNTVEKGTDPIEPFKETKVQIVEDEKLMKNFVEVFPTVPNEDKSDPNIKIANYVVSPIHKISKNESFRTKSERENSEKKRATIRKNLDEKRKFIKAMIEEIDHFLQKQKDIDRIREEELKSIK